MDILFCGDKNACKGMYLSALSLCNQNTEPLNIYILTAKVKVSEPISLDFAEKLQTAVRTVNKNSNVFIFDLTKEFVKYSPNRNLNTHFTPLCMLRLFADKAPQIPNKILYLDTDVLCRKSITELYNTNISNYEIAGVPDRYGKWFFGNIFKHNYLNSGVLLLNMQNIKKSGMFEKCRKRCATVKMFMPDQTAVNIYAKKLILPNKFNEQGKIKPNTVLKHFTTYFKFFPFVHTVTVKPWDEENLHKKLKIFEFDNILELYKRSNINE